jgi:PPOX class probable F420-dependent enzyme
MTVLAPDVAEFIRGPRVAVLATVRADGRPHTASVWYEYNGTEFVISTMRGSQKAKNVRAKGFATLCITTQEMPYRQVIAEGTARVAGAIDNVWRERVATRYIGERAGKAYVRDTYEMDNVAIHLRPLKWITEGFGMQEAAS